MSKKSRTKWIAGIAIIASLVVLEMIFQKPFFNTARDRLTTLLHLHKKVQVKADSIVIHSPDFLEKYFNIFGYQQTWTDTSGENDKYRDMLIEMFHYADSLGLDRKDYHNDYISKFDSLSHLHHFDYSSFEAENELIFTDAALTFLYHVAYGKDINIGFNGIKYNIDSARILRVFNQLLVHRDWRQSLDSLEPKISQYLVLKSELNRMNALIKSSPALDTALITNDDKSKSAIITKLQAYGLLDNAVNTDSISPKMLTAALKNFQRMMSVDTSGKLDERTIGFLNFPLSQRIAQIKESLNDWRWTGRLREKEFVLINIPAARLQVIAADTSKDFGMRVIVGKKSTQTPAFTAYINSVSTFPYWVVPISIATKEMLPKIRQQISYLDDNNIQVINGKGEVVDEQRVDWNRYSEKYFPYTLRQGTGCDNSLGILKFDLNSPYSIYLHDTNAKGLFGSKERFLSHGCIRLEKPMVLAEFILKEGLDTSVIAKLNQSVADQKPADFGLRKRIPVLIFIYDGRC